MALSKRIAKAFILTNIIFFMGFFLDSWGLNLYWILYGFLTAEFAPPIVGVTLTVLVTWIITLVNWVYDYLSGNIDKEKEEIKKATQIHKEKEAW